MNSLVGWQSELEVALAVKQRIFLHGNVFDLYAQNDEPYNLTGWLLQKLCSRGYELILGYDVVDGQTILHGEQAQVDAIIRGRSPLAQEQERNPAQQNPNTNPPANARENNPRNAPAQPTNRPAPAARNQRPADPSQADLAAQLQRLRAILENDLHSTALICTHCDKVVAHGQLFNLPERRHSVLISKLTERTWETQSFRRRLQRLQNLVILIYDQEGLIPVELYLTDPTAKVIHIPYPTFETRNRFFDLNWTMFNGHEQLPKVSRIEAPHGSQPGQGPVEVKNCETFARLTEGFTLQELYQLASYSHAGNFPVTDFRNLLTFFRSGRRDNPWDAIDDDKLRSATATLEGEVIGQTGAIKIVVGMLHRAKAELARVGSRGSMKPRGILFFVGPTGVGKTMLARKLAEFLFETEEACTVFDMSEFKEDHTIARLIGSPPGYIGHDTGGQLTNKVRERPFSVLLFDEIEKAHKRILDIFLQILESGRLTDGKGQTVSFSEAVIIFTSNIGTKPDRKILRVLQKQGIDIRPEELANLKDEKALRAYFTSAVETYFAKGLNRPELFNRLGDNIVVFRYLTKEDCLIISKRTITDYFDRIRKRWREKWGEGANLQFEQEDRIITDIQRLVLGEQKYLEYGARGLENMIISKLETPLARLFNDKGLPKALHCRLRVDAAGEIKIDR